MNICNSVFSVSVQAIICLHQKSFYKTFLKYVSQDTFIIYLLGVREVKLSNFSQRGFCEVSLQNCKGCIGVVCGSPNKNISLNFPEKFFDTTAVLKYEIY